MLFLVAQLAKKGQNMGARGWKSKIEDRRQRTEGRGQKAEDRRQRQRTERALPLPQYLIYRVLHSDGFNTRPDVQDKGHDCARFTNPTAYCEPR